jgi:hypothetical protein
MGCVHSVRPSCPVGCVHPVRPSGPVGCVHPVMAVRSTLRAGCPLPPGRFLVLISVKRLSRPQGHYAAGRIRAFEKSNDLIGNRASDFPACSVVPQPTTLPRASNMYLFIINKKGAKWTQKCVLVSINAVYLLHGARTLNGRTWRQRFVGSRQWWRLKRYGKIVPALN